MWNPLFIWSLKAGLILSFLFAAYYLLFRNNTQFQLKRVLQIVILLAAISFPLIKISVSNSTIPTVYAFQQFDNSLTSENPVLNPSVELAPTSQVETQVSNFSKADVIWWIYLAGVSLSALIILIELAKLSYLLFKGNRELNLGENVISHPSVKYPFSFMKWIFVPTNSEYSEDDWRIVLAHENLHLSQKHTLDILFSSLTQCLLWYHPAVYLTQRSIKSNHEALADSAVLASTPYNQYSKTLLALSLRTNTLTLSHSFSLISSLSKRLKLMKIQKTSKQRTYASVFSFAVLALVIASQTVGYGQNKNSSDTQVLKMSDLWFSGSDSGSHSGKEIVEKSGKSPDTWVSLKPQHFTFPVIFLDKHQKLIDTFILSIQNENPDEEIRLQIAMNTEKSLKFDNIYEHYEPDPNRSELNIELTVEDRLAMFELTTTWVKENVHQAYPDYPMPSEMQYVTNKYLVIRPYTFNSSDTIRNKETAAISNPVTRKAQPVGGLDRFLKNVVTDIIRGESLNNEDLPDKIEFKFQVNRSGYISQLSLESKVKPNSQEDDVYALLRQLHNNIITVSNIYSWDPSIEKGKEITSWVTIEIPKSLLLPN
jgi:beta-lactamase regulating signal transducer with metallopeptidase domain